ncbi:MAG: hypothetical protein J7L82_06260 [Staphylothermus sp.]|nr:hypothetical protein [Staphylothermus sp.]
MANFNLNYFMDNLKAFLRTIYKCATSKYLDHVVFHNPEAIRIYDYGLIEINYRRRIYKNEVVITVSYSTEENYLRPSIRMVIRLHNPELMENEELLKQVREKLREMAKKYGFKYIAETDYTISLSRVI